MIVYIVYCNVDYEGSNVHSVHATMEYADAEVERLKTEHKFCDDHCIESHEVRKGD